MALQKNYNHKGIEANYWKIIDYMFNSLTNQTIINVALYVDKEARRNNINNYIHKKMIIVDGESTRDQLYPKLIESRDDNDNQLFINSQNV